VTSDLDFKVTTFFEVEYRENSAKDKRKLYLTYGTVLFGDLD